MKHERNDSSINRSIHPSISPSSSIHWFSNSDSSFINLNSSKHLLRPISPPISRLNTFNQKSQHQIFNETVSFFLNTGCFHQNKGIDMMIQHRKLVNAPDRFNVRCSFLAKIENPPMHLTVSESDAVLWQNRKLVNAPDRFIVRCSFLAKIEKPANASDVSALDAVRRKSHQIVKQHLISISISIPSSTILDQQT